MEEEEEAGARAEEEGVVRLVLCGGEGPRGLVLTTLHVSEINDSHRKLHKS